jgi:hypothetical protein
VTVFPATFADGAGDGMNGKSVGSRPISLSLGYGSVSSSLVHFFGGRVASKLPFRRNSISRLLIYRRALCGTRGETFQEVCNPPPTACLSTNFSNEFPDFKLLKDAYLAKYSPAVT